MREKQRPYYNFYRVKQGINNLILYALDEQRAIDQYCSCQSFARRESASLLFGRLIRVFLLRK